MGLSGLLVMASLVVGAVGGAGVVLGDAMVVSEGALVVGMGSTSANILETDIIIVETLRKCESLYEEVVL